MLTTNVIQKPILDMDQLEFEIALLGIFSNSDFINKDTVGKRMYSNALKHYQSCLKEKNNKNFDEKDSEKLIHTAKISTTEKESLIKSRIGQGIFKQRIIEKYEGKCIITGISYKHILIASHIKPWAVSSNKERLDSENGFYYHQHTINYLIWV